MKYYWSGVFLILWSFVFDICVFKLSVNIDEKVAVMLLICLFKQKFLFQTVKFLKQTRIKDEDDF